MDWLRLKLTVPLCIESDVYMCPVATASLEKRKDDEKTCLAQRDLVSAVEQEIAVLQKRFESHGTSLPLTRRPALDVADGCAPFLSF